MVQRSYYTKELRLAVPETATQDLSAPHDRPLQVDLDRCVHCGLCLNACPTYRELGLEADSPRGRIYQMVQVAEGNLAINDEYVEHIDLCLACRACETVCPSGVQYGKLVEAARGQIDANRRLPWYQRLVRWFAFDILLTSPFLLKVTGYKLLVYQKSGLQSLVRRLGILKLFGRLAEIEALSPPVETPFFFDKVGKVFPAEGETRHRVAFMAGCIANISFAHKRGDGSCLAEERLRGRASAGPGLLRRLAGSRRITRDRPPPSAAEYRGVREGQLRRRDYECRRLWFGG